MADCKYLLLVCLNSLLAGGHLTMEGISMTNHEGYRISPPGMRMEKMTKEVQTLTPSTTVKPRSSSWMDSEALSKLLVGIIRAELSQCILAIVWDLFFEGSTLIDTLSHLPNVKQVVGSGDIDRLMWGAKQCTAYIFLLVDPSSLMDQAEYAKHDAWDYSGRVSLANDN
ncbi:hypothetical protein E2C01_073066 [Portunus trituberculatus]|uniref:Uncharacterized protein n=1 Tax=Portunus trituberculatus TaxID=210409 RepID=A0A5B7I9K6_PORTR|nr:hypothetical protein [Portunus trituberculatus]